MTTVKSKMVEGKKARRVQGEKMIKSVDKVAHVDNNNKKAPVTSGKKKAKKSWLDRRLINVTRTGNWKGVLLYLAGGGWVDWEWNCVGVEAEVECSFQLELRRSTWVNGHYTD